jgi:hypothetical protein
MGFFDVLCAESGLPLADGAVCLPLAQLPDGSWAPLALPLRSIYNRLGSIDEPAHSLTAAGLARLRDQMTYPYDPSDGLEGMLQEMNRGVSEEDWVTWDGVNISFVLLDEGIYDAVIETLLHAGSPAHAPIDFAALAARPADELWSDTFIHAELTAKVYVGLDADDRQSLHEELLDLAVFLRWGTPLQPIDVETGGQYYCYESEQYPDDATRPLIDAARVRYAALPQMLEAVEANARRWIERGEDAE